MEVYFQLSLFGKMSWEVFHQMTGWILTPCLQRSRAPKFQCLLPGNGAAAGMVRGRQPDLAWRLMDAQYWASPRLARRQRIFLVADFGGRRAAEILFKPRGMLALSKAGAAGGLSAAEGDRSAFLEAGRLVPIVRPFQMFRMRAAAKHQKHTQFQNSFGFANDPFPTLLASAVNPFAFYFEDDPLGGCVRYPSEIESERMMGLPGGLDEVWRGRRRNSSSPTI